MMELEQESAEKYLCTQVDFLNPRDIQAMYAIKDEYYILLNTGVSLMVTEEIYNKAIKMVKVYYNQESNNVNDIYYDDYSNDII